MSAGTRHLLMRVEASSQVGLGHYYRSLNLAQVLQEQGWIVTAAHRPSAFWTQQAAWPYGELVLDVPTEEAQACLTFIAQQRVSVFYVDAIMDFDPAFMASVKDYCPVVFYQNLGASRELADVFILPSLPRTLDFYQAFSPETEVYEGLQYFIGHPDLTTLTRHQARPVEVATRIAFTAGGSDPQDTLWQLYHFLQDQWTLPDTSFYFYYGLAYARPSDSLPKRDKRFVFLPYDRAAILENDLLVSAFGVSTYEFLALGMPVLAYGHQASNARTATALAEQSGALHSLGLFSKLTALAFCDTLQRFCESPSARRSLRKQAESLLDLDGAKRVARICSNLVDALE